MLNSKKNPARDFDDSDWAGEGTAASSHPDWRAPSVQHKKGQPGSAISQQNAAGKPIFCDHQPTPPRYCLGLRRDRKIRTTGPSTSLWYYPNKCTRCNNTMRRQNDPARGRLWHQTRQKTQQWQKREKWSQSRPSYRPVQTSRTTNTRTFMASSQGVCTCHRRYVRSDPRWLSSASLGSCWQTDAVVLW